jgi:hypothetical protein
MRKLYRIGTVVLIVAATWLMFKQPGTATRSVSTPTPAENATASTAGSVATLMPEPAAAPLRLSAFPDSSARLIAAAEAGRPIRIRLGDGAEGSWGLRPITVTAENFKVSTGSKTRAEVAYRVYEGFPQAGTGVEAGKAFVAVADGAVSAILLTDEGATHVKPNESGQGWTVLREEAITGPGAECVHEDGGLCTHHGGAALVVWNDGSKGAISIEPEPEVAASDGRDPLDGTLTLTTSPIPYGPKYDASLKTILGLMVDESIGNPTQATVSSETANYLALAASLNAMYENQVGLRYLLQELILIGTGSDFNTPALAKSGSSDGAEMGYFDTWLQTHRPFATQRWTVASKIGAVYGANGRAYVASAGGSRLAINTNNGPTIAVVGHEIGHNLGSDHTGGGIMNPSGTNSRSFLTTVKDSSPAITGAKAISNVMKIGTRAYGSATLRDAAEFPFANDDTAATLAGKPVVLDVLANDTAAVPLGATNTLRVVEVGAVHPAGAGTLSFSQNQVSFAPAPGFSGTAYFTYTVQGSVGNGGAGWLHKGDVAVVVHDPEPGAPTVAAARGAASGNHNNARAEVTWSFPSGRPFRWEIARSANGGAFESVALVDGRNRNWFDLSISLAASVQYRVRAHDGQDPVGPWGLSPVLTAAGTTRLWDGFDSGDINQWTVWNNTPTSTAANDATAPLYNVSVTNGAVRMQTAGAAPRIGLLVSNQRFDLSQTGELSLAADLTINQVTNWRRFAAWIDDGGAVIWVGIERDLDNNNPRKVRLYAADSLTDFFARVGVYNAAGQLYENSLGGGGGSTLRHRATLTVSNGGVGMTAFPADNGTGRASTPASTLGLLPHGLANFTGKGRFAVGGYASPTGSNVVTFTIDNLSISSEPVPQKFLPALVDDTITMPRGGWAGVNPVVNDLGPTTNPRLSGSLPAGLVATTTGAESGGYLVRALPTATPGGTSFKVSAKTADYTSSGDGLTGLSTVHVEITDGATQTAADTFTLIQGDGSLRFNPLLNDTAVGFRNTAQIQPRLTTTSSGTTADNSYRLVSATLLTPALGSIVVEQLKVMVNGVLTARPTGEITFTPADSSTTGVARIQYVLEDVHGNQSTGEAVITIVPSGHPRILAHPLSAAVAGGDPLELSVTAQGSGTLTYQWFLDDVPLSGATNPVYAVAATTAANQGTYTVAVSNATGTATSLPAFVDVQVPVSPLDEWRAERFNTAQLADPAISGPAADPDADGLPNLLEYALALDPSAPDPEPNVRITNIGPNGELSLTFLRARSDLTYTVEASSDLAPDSWAVIATNPGDVSLTTPVTVTDTEPATPRRFLRLRVTSD